MKTTVLAGLAGSLVIAGAASAAFTGWGANTYLVDASGNQVTDVSQAVYSVLDFYATFDAPATVVNVFNMNISWTGGPLFHNDLAGGSFAPQFSANSFDSFVTIGGSTGFANSTQADPNWGALGFNNGGQTIPALAGWFNSNPPNQQGAAQAGLGGFAWATFLGRFIISAPGAGDELAVFNVAGSITAGGQQPFAESSFKFAAIPAPGALALLGLAGLAGSRRRRA